MKPAQTLVLQLGDKRGKTLHLADVYIDLSFFTNGRYCYAFRFGPTDRQGQLRVTYYDAEAKRVSAAKFNLMDYNTPLDNCDDRLKIKIPSVDELGEAYEWNAKCSGGIASPEAEGWLKAANTKFAENEISLELQGVETVVTVPF